MRSAAILVAAVVATGSHLGTAEGAEFDRFDFGQYATPTGFNSAPIAAFEIPGAPGSNFLFFATSPSPIWNWETNRYVFSQRTFASSPLPSQSDLNCPIECGSFNALKSEIGAQVGISTDRYSVYVNAGFGTYDQTTTFGWTPNSESRVGLGFELFLDSDQALWARYEHTLSSSFGCSSLCWSGSSIPSRIETDSIRVGFTWRNWRFFDWLKPKNQPHRLYLGPS